MSSSWGLVDFAIRLVNTFLNLSNGQVKYFGTFNSQKNCNQSCSSKKKCFGLVKVILGLVNASCRLTQWRAVKLTFFAPCECCFLLLARPRSLPMLFISVIHLEEKSTATNTLSLNMNKSLNQEVFLVVFTVIKCVFQLFQVLLQTKITDFPYHFIFFNQ